MLEEEEDRCKMCHTLSPITDAQTLVGSAKIDYRTERHLWMTLSRPLTSLSSTMPMISQPSMTWWLSGCDPARSHPWTGQRPKPSGLCSGHRSPRTYHKAFWEIAGLYIINTVVCKPLLTFLSLRHCAMLWQSLDVCLL